MGCAPLSYPPEWKAVVDRDFLLGVPLIGPQVAVYKAVCAELAQRGPECWSLWGTSESRVSLARFASVALGEAALWPNPIFVPEDPFTLVLFNHRATAIDGLEVESALRSIEGHVGHRLRRKVWEQLFLGSFGAAIDRLLAGGHRGGA
jgi:hypothetical protein